ncbi:hypothetical protein HRI_000007500 [Hibiscus trionum]|uniref:Uncharacterized protein n=1 Tax=Hibiscus trionum TaxID=183268 RepID=A0A9W7GPH3_HIBTR|nr:hypothetical protein HRI_000007500 [Hibiscus trionum]
MDSQKIFGWELHDGYIFSPFNRSNLGFPPADDSARVLYPLLFLLNFLSIFNKAFLLYFFPDSPFSDYVFFSHHSNQKTWKSFDSKQLIFQEAPELYQPDARN